MRIADHMFRVSRFDLLLGGLLLLVSFGSLFAVRRMMAAEGSTALVYSDGRLVSEYALSETRSLTVGHTVIQILEGRVRIQESDCPRRVCTRTGWISHPSQTIVCVPNRLLIEIAGTAPDAPYHAVSY